MKTRLQLLFIVCFFAQAMFGQVGINTTTPNAQLEIKSSNQATPANTDGVIIPKIDAFPATNPTAAQQGMMVYLTSTSAGKSPGFYYWNNPTTTWLALGGADDDWSGAGTGVMKSNYNTDKVTIGPGAGTASKLDVVTGNAAGLFNGLKVNNNNTSAGGITYGATIENNATGTNPKYGIYSSVSLDGTGPKTALMTGLETSTSQTQSAIGIENIVNAPGTGERTGIDNQLFSLNPLNTSDVAGVKNYFEDSNKGKTLGVSNQFDGSAGGNVSTYEITGLKNQFDNAGLSPKFGSRNIFSVYSAGEQVGVENQFLSNDDSAQYGVKSTFNNTGSTAPKYGSFTEFHSGITSSKFGTFNHFLDTANNDFGAYNYFELYNNTGQKIGFSNRFEGDKGGIIGFNNEIYASGVAGVMGFSNILQTSYGGYGIYNSIDDATTDNTRNVIGNFTNITGGGLTNWYGSAIQLDNSNAASTGDRYGYLASIYSTGGTGTNYGVYSVVPDDSNSYSGYFLGRVSIGPHQGLAGTNNYIMPLQRGTNGQIMQTDTSGNVTWQNPSSVMGSYGWLLNGNSGTNPATHFLGTTDNQPIRFKQNNLWAGEFKASNGNLFLGLESGMNTTVSSSDNTALGSRALKSNTTGIQNIAIGTNSQLNNTNWKDNISIGHNALKNFGLINNNGSAASGTVVHASTSIYDPMITVDEASNIAIGTRSMELSSSYLNVAIGVNTLRGASSGSANVVVGGYSMENGSGDYNVAVGCKSLSLGGIFNTAVGYRSMVGNTGTNNVGVGNNAAASGSGSENTAVGAHSMYYNSTSGQTAVGFESLYSNSGSANVAVGYKALRANAIGSNNSAMGYTTLTKNTSGQNNSAFGANSLSENTIGDSNAAFGTNSLGSNTTGTSNAAFGSYSLYSNTTGNFNLALGFFSMVNNTTGIENVAVGQNSLFYNSTGNKNTAVGSVALNANTTGIENVAVGNVSLKSNTVGNYNTAMGSNSLFTNTTGVQNVAHGYRSLFSNTTGGFNTALGENALAANTTASDNTAVGSKSMTASTSGNLNTAVGSNALAANTTGAENTTLGYKSLFSNLIGLRNTAIGNESLLANTASNNNAIGYRALFKNTTGTPNTAVGSETLRENTTGSNNSALGYFALNANVTGNQNTAIGVEALKVSTTNNNTALGYRAAYQQVGGTRNVAIGSLTLSGLTNNSFNTAVGSSTYTTGNFSNSSVLGDGVAITADNQVRIGDTGVNSIGGQVGWTTLSDKRFKEDIQENVPGLSFISKLKPVTYHVNARKVYDFTHKNQSDDEKAAYLSQLPSSVCSGFLAQDVEAAAKSIGYEFSGVDKPKNESDYYGLRYAEFVVPLVKAVQEQQQIIEHQQKQLQDLATRLEKLEQFIKR